MPHTKYSRHSSSAVVLDGQLYVIGGLTLKDGKEKNLDIVEKFNPVTEEWCLVSSLRKCNGKELFTDYKIFVDGENVFAYYYKRIWFHIPTILRSKS